MTDLDGYVILMDDIQPSSYDALPAWRGWYRFAPFMVQIRNGHIIAACRTRIINGLVTLPSYGDGSMWWFACEYV